MKKSKSILSMSVLAASLMIPMGASADVNPPGNRRERQELREDLQRLERLRQQRDRELRQGDRRKPVNTTRRYATRSEKFVKTGERSTAKTTDGIVITITAGIAIVSVNAGVMKTKTDSLKLAFSGE
jgi:hypothetical protein